jgi:hypothetical protein
MIASKLLGLAFAASLTWLSAGPCAAAATAASTATPARVAFRPYFEERWPPGTPISVAQVRAMIARHGATWTVQRLSAGDSPNRWDSVMRGIASGTQAWLDLAPLLRPGTDAATSEVYVIALSDALVANAAGALSLIAAEGDDSLCQENGIETEPAHARAYYAAAIEAVEAVRAPALQAACAICLAQLRAGAAPLEQAPH